MLNIATTAKGWFGNNRGNCKDTATPGQLNIKVPPVTKPQNSTVTRNWSAQSSLMSEPKSPAGVEALLAQAEYTAREVDAALPVVSPVSAAQTEAALIARVQTGDQAAFGELVELHQDFVYNLAYRILQTHEEADDASQEAFVKIWQALPGFRGEARFTTWAYRIVRNTCLNRVRSTKSQPRLVSVETSFAQGEEEEREIITNLPGEQTEEPAWRFDTDERRNIIWQQVDSLPLKYREIIALYYQQEMSYEEIAAALEVPVGTVKTHLYRAKALLKARLIELYDQGSLDIGY